MTGIWGTIPVILQLIFLEGILSLDNAMVLGSLVAHLPKSDAIPLPPFLRRRSSLRSRLLGNQRQAALRVGLLGAYLGQGLMLLLASYIIRNPWLKVLGALYLLKLAVAHLGELSQTHFSSQEKLRRYAIQARFRANRLAQRAGASFWSTVLVVELSDLAFSLDNVVAAVAVSPHFWTVFVGVALGIALMRLATGFFVQIINRQPILIDTAYILILVIAGELLAEAGGLQLGDLTKFAVSLTTVVLVLGYHRCLCLHFLDPLWQKISQFFWLLISIWHRH